MNVRSLGQMSWTGGGLNSPKCSSQTHDAFSMASRAIWYTLVLVEIIPTAKMATIQRGSPARGARGECMYRSPGAATSSVQAEGD